MRYVVLGMVTIMLSFSAISSVSADTTQLNKVFLLQLQVLLLQLEQQLAILPQSALVLASTSVVTPTAQPVCDTFTAVPATITDASDTVTLSWTTTNAQIVSINHNIGTRPVDGSVTVKPGKTVTYILTASKALGIAGVSANCTATVTLKPKPAPLPLCDSFTAASTSILSGASTTITWKTTNATSVSINNALGSVPLDGTKTVKPASTTLYTLTATNIDGAKVTCKTKTITVKPLPLPVCDSFTVSPADVTVGQSAMLTWKTTNATTVSISDSVGTVPVDGTKSVKPTSTTKYILTATNDDSVKVTCAKTVTVVPAQPNLSFCVATLKTKFGTLCAIQPSKTDSRILDKSATGTILASDKGFGYHIFAVPDNWLAAKGVWVHFTGTYGRPYDQTPLNSQSGDPFSDPLWIDEIMEKGYTVLQPAYDNQYTVGGELCGKTTPGYLVDNCSGAVREMGLTGKGDGAGRRYDDQYNTIDYRLKKLVGYIEDTQKIQLPDTISADNIDWSKLEVSGHSQGADQTYFIAKQRVVHSACIMAGTYEVPDIAKTGFKSPEIADWYVATKTIATPKASIRAVMVEQDNGKYGFYETLTKVIGLPTNQLFVESSSPYADSAGRVLDPHAATIKDPTLKAIRAQACF